MSLIHCLECDHEISSDAKYCVHCGYPIAAKQKKHFSLSLTSIDEDPNSTTDFLISELKFAPEKAQNAVEHLPIILDTEASYDKTISLKHKLNQRSEELRITEKVFTESNNSTSSFSEESLKKFGTCLMILGVISLLAGIGGAMYAANTYEPAAGWLATGAIAAIGCFAAYNLFHGISDILRLLRNIDHNTKS